MSLVSLASALNARSVCRGCLAAGGQLSSLSERGLTQDFYSFADVPIVIPDVPEMVCAACEESLLACKRFRLQCQRSSLLLQELVTKSPEDKSFEESNDQDITILTNLTEHNFTISVQTADTTSKINLPCPFKCGNTYLKQKDLLLHLKRTHKRGDHFEVLVQYYCPYKCNHNMEAARPKPFQGRKYLNQHLLKVHTERSLLCISCSQYFRSSSELSRHLRDCSEVFQCYDCGGSYRSREALLVHLKRKHPETHANYKEDKQRSMRDKRARVDSLGLDSPKRSSSTQTLEHVRNDVFLSSGSARHFSSIETQTALEFSVKADDELLLGMAAPEFKETQTCLCLTSAQTQTPLADALPSSSTQTCFDDSD